MPLLGPSEVHASNWIFPRHDACLAGPRGSQDAASQPPTQAQLEIVDRDVVQH